MLRNRHGGMLCVTLGAQGAAVLDGDRFVHQPGFQVDAVDTTGAGDVFRAGFIYACCAATQRQTSCASPARPRPSAARAAVRSTACPRWKR